MCKEVCREVHEEVQDEVNKEAQDEVNNEVQEELNKEAIDEMEPRCLLSPHRSTRQPLVSKPFILWLSPDHIVTSESIVGLPPLP